MVKLNANSEENEHLRGSRKWGRRLNDRVDSPLYWDFIFTLVLEEFCEVFVFIFTFSVKSFVVLSGVILGHP